MKKQKTKRALLMSVISVLMSCAMLVGTTFAWFTDSVSSGRNHIVAGNLDVELEYAKQPETVIDNIAEDAWKTVDEESNVFGDALWEPGHAEVVYLRIKNVGTLALKYRLAITVASETKGTNAHGDDIKLSEYIKAGISENLIYADRASAVAAVSESASKLSGGLETINALESEQSCIVALVLYMPDNVGDNANYREDVAPTIDLGINLWAAQAVKESDSFGNDYDKDAEYDIPEDPKNEAIEKAREAFWNAWENYENEEPIEETEEMKSITASTVSKYKSSTNDTSLPPGITYKNTTLVFHDDDSITIRHSFSATKPSLAKNCGLTDKVDGYYVKEVTVAGPKEYSTFTETKLKNWTIKYSVLSYAYSVLNSSSTDKQLKSLVRALVAYYNAVMAE